MLKLLVLIHPYGITNDGGITVLWTLQEVISITEPPKGERKAVFRFFKIILLCLIKFVRVSCHYTIQDSAMAVEAVMQFQIKLCPAHGKEAQPHT